MQKFMKLLTVLTCCMAMTLSANAAFEQTGNREVKVSGTGAEPGTMVTLQVFKGEKAPEDLLDENLTDFLEILVCHDQSVVNDEGAYSFTFNIGGGSDTYTAYTSFEGTGAAKKETLYFVDESDLISALSELNAANVATSAEVKNEGDTSVEDIISDPDKAQILGFTSKKGTGINKTALSKILFSYINNPNNTFTENDRTVAIKAYEQCLFVQRLNESKITNIFDEQKYARLESNRGGIKDWYEESFVKTNLQKEMTAKLSGKGFTAVSEYEDMLSEAFVLATAKYPNGYSNLQKVLKAFCEEADIEEKKITSSVCRALSGNSYDNYTQIKNAVTKLAASGGSGGSGGGGGGGGSVGGTASGNQKPIDIEIQGPQAPSAPVVLPEKPFSDLQNVSWAEESINYLAGRGIVNGKGDGRFCPDDMVTREEFTKMIVEAFNIKDEADISFNDVAESSWYYTYVKRAYGASIIKGMNEATFGSGRNITRQDMAVICLNVAEKIGIDAKTASEDVFKDDASIADYAKKAVYTLKQLGVIGGMGDNSYEPQGFATRAQAAVIMHRLLSL